MTTLRRRSTRISELFEGGEGDREEQTAKNSASEVGPGGRGGKVDKTINEGDQYTKGDENEYLNLTFNEHSANNVNSEDVENIRKLAIKIRGRGQ